MKIRGRRECKDCGVRWAYYETGSVTCPECGSIRSVGLDDERVQHTDSPATLDLTEARNAVDARPFREVASLAEGAAREYVRRRGFIVGGELRTLDDTYLAASELRHAADVLGRARAVTDEEELYFLTLLRGADTGERPAVADVPGSLTDARGLAYGDALRAYHRDVLDWTKEHEVGRHGRSTLETLDEHAKRVRALEGDVPPETAERLVSAARDLARYLEGGDEDALASARDTLGRLDA